MMIKNRSNRDMIGSEIYKLLLRFFDLSYLPNLGLAAAKIDVLLFRVACTPAFDKEIVCCYIASCIAT